MFWLHRHLPAKQALNSKGYERIIREILRRYGYFRLIRTNFTIFTYIFAKKQKTPPTFQMNHSFVGSFHHNRFISSLIALQPCRTAGLVAHKTLVTLQHKDWSIDEIKIIFGVLIHSIAIGKKMAGFFCTDKFVIVGWNINILYVVKPFFNIKNLIISRWAGK